MARTRNITHPRPNTDHKGVVATARGRAEDWEMGLGVVAALDVETSLARPSMDLEAWAVYVTLAAYWSAGRTTIRLSALARSAGITKKSAEAALCRAGGLSFAQWTESCKRLPKGAAFVYKISDGIVRFDRALDAWRNQGVYIRLPVDIVRAAPSAAALRLFIALEGVAVRRDENAWRSWSRERLRSLLGLPPAADVDAEVADALLWAHPRVRADRRVVVDHDGVLAVAAEPAKQPVAKLIADGFNPLTSYSVPYASRAALRSVRVFDGPVQGQRMVLPGLWAHRAVHYLCAVGAVTTGEQLIGQWLVYVHAVDRGVKPPLAVRADLSGGVRLAFSAFVDSLARLAVGGHTWLLSGTEVDVAKAARVRRWLFRKGYAGANIHAWTDDGRVMTEPIWRQHEAELDRAAREDFRKESEIRTMKAAEAELWHVGRPVPIDLPPLPVSTGALGALAAPVTVANADVVTEQGIPSFPRVDAKDIRRALAKLISESTSDAERTLGRVAMAYARDLADAPRRLMKEVLRRDGLPHLGLAQAVLTREHPHAGDTSALWRGALDAMACEGDGDDLEEAQRRAARLLADALRDAQDAVVEETQSRAMLRADLLAREKGEETEASFPAPGIQPDVDATLVSVRTAAEPFRPHAVITRPFRGFGAGAATPMTTVPVPVAPQPDVASTTTASPAMKSPVVPVASGTLGQLERAIALLPARESYSGPLNALTRFYLPALAKQLGDGDEVRSKLRICILVRAEGIPDGLRCPEGAERTAFEQAVVTVAEAMRASSCRDDRESLVYAVGDRLRTTVEALAEQLGLGHLVPDVEVG
ncbi:hypothetical protein EI613_32620 (plasmid) [Azospirillum sp. 412522]|nr:hypothetical protein [Azospirillum sp. 412522]MBY6266590.1 hypothetical protein [Azospirillum sp. 412522]